MKHIHFASKALPIFAALSLCACTTQPQTGVGAAVVTPLNDLNIVHSEIPPVLQQAQKQPYAKPADQDCAALDLQVQKLDEVLGADLDTPSSASNPSLIERGSDVAKNEALGALQRTAEGIVPFRGWVRKISGAERYSRQVSAAITAGTVRRAYLKGIRVSQGCITDAPTQVTAAMPPSR